MKLWRCAIQSHFQADQPREEKDKNEKGRHDQTESKFVWIKLLHQKQQQQQHK